MICKYIFEVRLFSKSLFLQLAIECPRLNIPNTNIISLERSVGGVVNLSCSDKRRHRHVSGHLIRTCSENETWTGTPPVCEGRQYQKTTVSLIFIH